MKLLYTAMLIGGGLAWLYLWIKLIFVVVMSGDDKDGVMSEVKKTFLFFIGGTLLALALVGMIYASNHVSRMP